MTVVSDYTICEISMCLASTRDIPTSVHRLKPPSAMMANTLLVAQKISVFTFGKHITTTPSSHLCEGIVMTSGRVSRFVKLQYSTNII